MLPRSTDCASPSMSSLGLTPSSYTGPQPQRDHDKVLTVNSRAADEARSPFDCADFQLAWHLAGRSPTLEEVENACLSLTPSEINGRKEGTSNVPNLGHYKISEVVE